MAALAQRYSPGIRGFSVSVEENGASRVMFRLVVCTDAKKSSSGDSTTPNGSPSGPPGPIPSPASVVEKVKWLMGPGRAEKSTSSSENVIPFAPPLKSLGSPTSATA